MARLSFASARMGNLLLKGWVLSADTCPNCSTPLMHSHPSVQPRMTTCVKCDSEEHMSSARGGAIQDREESDVSESSSTPNISTHSSSSSSPHQHSSSPPTSLSNRPDSPELQQPFMAALDPAEILRRREQSDRASAEIGNRLLKGWAMLADECPNPECYGVPLVRPPRSKEGVPSSNKECVACGTVYTAGGPSHPTPTKSQTVQRHSANPPPSPPPASTPPPAPPVPVRTAPEAIVVAPLVLPQYTAPSPITPASPMSSTLHSLLPTIKPTLVTTLSTLDAQLQTLLQKRPLPAEKIGEVATAIGCTIEALQKLERAVTEAE